MAKVATGMPLGIWTVESSESSPWRCFEGMFVNPGDPVYEGMIVGIHSRDNDLVVNPIRTKQLTNIRASGKDEAILLTPPIGLTLEYAVEFIGEDELVEITPKSIRLRKRHLQEHERRRAERAAA